MQKKIFAFITEHGMLEQGDRLVVGVSGGADSVCLLRVLRELKDTYALELYAVHVNHGLRGEEADRDECFVAALCEELGVPCHIVRLNIREEAKRLQLGEEEAGREWRYRSFAEEAKKQGCTKIAVAHHMDDNAETLLFRIFRGTGISGLSGIAPVSRQEKCVKQSADEAQEYTVIRPLLCVTRAEVEEYLASCGQAYCTDSTNQENTYSRNRIRNEILPVASGYINAQSVRNLNALAKQAAAVTDYLERQAEELYQRCVSAEENRLTVSLQGDEEPVLLELVLRRCMYALAGKKRDISAVHIEALCGLCTKQVGSRLDLPYGIRAKRSYEGILLSADKENQNTGQSIEEQGYRVMIEKENLMQGKTVTLPDGRGSLTFSVKEIRTFGADACAEIVKNTQNDYTKCFDYDNIKGNISVRTPKECDYICIHPDGRRKMLKDYMVDAKVPQEERKRLFLVTEDETVLWIPGMRTGENRRISEQTQKVLLIEWNL